MDRENPHRNGDGKRLEDFFLFINADIKSLRESDFISMLLSYARFICHDDSNYDFLNTQSQYERYINGILNRTDPKIMGSRKELFSRLQKYLRGKIDQVIEAALQVNQASCKVLGEMKGTRKLIVDLQNDSFFVGFWPDGVKSSDSISYENEKILADLAFTDMIQQMGLKPRRFGICTRKECNNIYYRQTKKPRQFCSDRCASVIRQRKYQSTKRAKSKKG